MVTDFATPFSSDYGAKRINATLVYTQNVCKPVAVVSPYPQHPAPVANEHVIAPAFVVNVKVFIYWRVMRLLPPKGRYQELAHSPRHHGREPCYSLLIGSYYEKRCDWRCDLSKCLSQP